MTTRIKVEKNKGYTVMSNHHLRNKKMSLKSKGLMSLMLSLPDNWDFTEMGLVSIVKEKRDAVRSSLKELEDNGYLVREKRNRNDGKFGGYDYTLYEIPHRVGFTVSDKPSTVKPMLEKPTQISTKVLSTDKQVKNNKEIYKEKFESYTNNQELIQALNDFVKFRKDIKSPLTERAITLTLNELDRLSSSDNEKIEILNQSIMNGWKGVFKINNRKGKLDEDTGATYS